MSAEEAMHWGLVCRVYPYTELMDRLYLPQLTPSLSRLIQPRYFAPEQGFIVVNRRFEVARA